MDEIIKMLAQTVIDRLNAMEQETDFDHLLSVPDPELRAEAYELHKGIQDLKDELGNIL